MDQLPLKDIHLPEKIGWWPPAPGWWLVAIVTPLLVLLTIYIYKQLKRKTALKTARKMLFAIKNDKQQDKLQSLTSLSILLRRVAISTSPRTDVAGLSGQAWLNYLDTAFKDKPFSNGAGRCLADVQFRKTVPEDTDLEALFKLCERWLQQQKPSKIPKGLKTGKAT